VCFAQSAARASDSVKVFGLGDGLLGLPATNWVRFAHFALSGPSRPAELGSFCTNLHHRDSECAEDEVEVIPANESRITSVTSVPRWWTFEIGFVSSGWNGGAHGHPQFLAQKSRSPRAKDALPPKTAFSGAPAQNTRIPHEPKRYSGFFAQKRRCQDRLAASQSRRTEDGRQAAGGRGERSFAQSSALMQSEDDAHGR
jgi:hypothetical protein